MAAQACALITLAKMAGHVQEALFPRGALFDALAQSPPPFPERDGTYLLSLIAAWFDALERESFEPRRN